MTIPLMHYLQTISPKPWVRHSLTAAMMLCALAALGSYSRGAFLAIAAMVAFLWLKSQHKVRMGALFMLAIPPALAFMPAQWTERMDTINNYEEDGSVQGRFNAWWMAYNLAKDHPLTGGGLRSSRLNYFMAMPPIRRTYMLPTAFIFRRLVSMVLLAWAYIFCSGYLTWRTGSWIIRNTANLKGYRVGLKFGDHDPG